MFTSIVVTFVYDSVYCILWFHISYTCSCCTGFLTITTNSSYIVVFSVYEFKLTARYL